MSEDSQQTKQSICGHCGMPIYPSDTLRYFGTYVAHHESHCLGLLKAEIADLQASFDLRWKADMRAIKRWQEAHPGSELTWPDHADLCVWLMEQLELASAKLAEVDEILAANWISPEGGFGNGNYRKALHGSGDVQYRHPRRPSRIRSGRRTPGTRPGACGAAPGRLPRAKTPRSCRCLPTA
jgi:hypothetical protein